MLLYYITDRKQLPGTEIERRRLLLQKIAEAARSGVDFIQLREKDLTTRELESLAREAVHVVRQNSLRTENPQPATVLLVNAHTDVAVAVGAGGVHLSSNDISAETARAIGTEKRGAGARWTVAISCHSAKEVVEAGNQHADFSVFAPVFEKRYAPAVRPAGLEALREACHHKIPVLALGGVTLQNASACMEAGAAGIAGIRLFQDNAMAEVVARLRSA